MALSFFPWLNHDFFNKLDDSEVVLILGNEIRNELHRLNRASPSVEAGTKKRITGSSIDQSPSQKLFGEDYLEVNRTLLSILILRWLLTDQYEKLTATQPENTRLSRESFDRLRGYFNENLQSLADVHDLIVLTVISDLGKDPVVTQNHQVSIRDGLNHDQALYAAAKAGREPCLTAQERPDDILISLKFSAALNLQQVVQGECPAGSLQAAFCLQHETRAFNLKIMEIFLDVAGAAANEEPHSSLTFNEPVFRTFMCARVLLKRLLDNCITVEECYDSILCQHNDVLVRDGFTGLGLEAVEDRALLRLFAMGRVHDAELAGLFQHAFRSLEPRVSVLLSRGLNVTGIHDGIAILPYYMPDLIALGLKNCQDSRKGKIRTTVSS